MKFKTILIIVLTILVLADVAFTAFLFVEQGDIYKQVKSNQKNIENIADSFNRLVGQMGEEESSSLERRNSIKVTNAAFKDGLLAISYKLGSDISKVTKVYQDWGDHTKEPKVADIPFEMQGPTLIVSFEPVVQPASNEAVIVVEAESVSVDEKIVVETVYNASTDQVRQDGTYAREPF